MPFRFEDNSVLIKYNEIRNKIKVAGLKFQSKPVYDEKYIKTKVKTFNGVVNTIIWGWQNSQRRCTLLLHSSNNYWLCHKDTFKYIKKNADMRQKKKMVRFIDVELELDDSDGSDSE